MQRISITNPQNIIDGTAKKYYFKLRNTGGPKGDKGEKGDTGATGPQGPQGDPCTVVVNSTATLEPGSSAYVTNTGSLSNAVLNFGIPQGPRGPQGIRGERGEAGQKGDTGPRGPQGERGTNATVTVGTTITTEPGTQAYAWNSSSNPSNAVINFDIPRGATGPQGPTGPAGQNFTPTIVAELPTTGEENKLYLTPKAHTSQTATGNPITATITDGAGSIESFQLDGDTFQQTYTGKNLCGISDQTFTDQGITVTIKDDEVTINGTTTGASTNSIPFIESTVLNGDYTTNLIYVSGSKSDSSANVNLRRASDHTLVNGTQTDINGGNSYRTYSISNESVELGFYAQRGTVFDNLKFKIQIVAGSTADYDFEPYTGGQASPSPSYPQQIQTVTGVQTVEVVGKNLFNKSAATIGYRLGLDGLPYQDNLFALSEYIPITPSTSYAYSRGETGNGASAIAFYDSNKAFISRTMPTIGISSVSGTITSPNNAFYARIAELKTLVDTVQLELGSTASAYTPYTSTNYPISLGSIELCKLGDYQDYIWKDGDSWKVHKATANYQITGQESDLQINTSQTNTARFFSNTALAATGAAPGGNSALILCNRLERDTTIWSTDVVGIYVNQAAIVGRMNKTVIGTTIEAARSYFANNPTLICYQLATATDTTITDTDLIAQLESIRTASLENGTNTITNSTPEPNLAGDMEIGYYGYNPRNRYDKWLWLDINNEYEQIGS